MSPRQEVRLTYSSSQLLTHTAYSSGQLFTYTYDTRGRLTSAVLPTGEMIHTPTITPTTRGTNNGQSGEFEFKLFIHFTIIKIWWARGGGLTTKHYVL